MFTGLIEGIGIVNDINKVDGDIKLGISPSFDMSDCKIGDSIAVNGICLTITELKSDSFQVDVSRETASRTTIRHLRVGNDVNLERALRLTDRLGGHLVSGHVDSIGKIQKIEDRGQSVMLRIGIEEKISKYIIAKGSIAIDGTSLTINDCKNNYFEVNIIPQTGKETNILKKRVGDLVNIETDIIGKYIESLLFDNKTLETDNKEGNIDQETLKKYGFI